VHPGCSPGNRRLVHTRGRSRRLRCHAMPCAPPCRTLPCAAGCTVHVCVHTSPAQRDRRLHSHPVSRGRRLARRPARFHDARLTRPSPRSALLEPRRPKSLFRLALSPGFAVLESHFSLAGRGSRGQPAATRGGARALRPQSVRTARRGTRSGNSGGTPLRVLHGAQWVSYGHAATRGTRALDSTQRACMRG
jgi:hypothetical protein